MEENRDMGLGILDNPNARTECLDPMWCLPVAIEKVSKFLLMCVLMLIIGQLHHFATMKIMMMIT
jgi:hypothetical protein